MTDEPRRLQLRRTRGWRLPPGARSVARPGVFGNPFRVGVEAATADQAAALFEDWLRLDDGARYFGDRRARLLERLPELRGRDLACWCPLDQPCHADVLIQMANSGGGS